MEETGSPAFVMYGAIWCPDVALARRFLKRHDVTYTYRDIDKDPKAKAALLELSGKGWLIPTVVMPDGKVLANPSVRELARELGISRRRK